MKTAFLGFLESQQPILTPGELVLHGSGVQLLDEEVDHITIEFGRTLSCLRLSTDIHDSIGGSCCIASMAVQFACVCISLRRGLAAKPQTEYSLFDPLRTGRLCGGYRWRRRRLDTELCAVGTAQSRPRWHVGEVAPALSPHGNSRQGVSIVPQLTGRDRLLKLKSHTSGCTTPLALLWHLFRVA